jgi:predicted permease
MLARLLIRGAAWLVPADQRHDWRREWLAELAIVDRSGRSTIRFAAGAPRHAASLRFGSLRSGIVIDDARFAVRALRRRPGFAALAIGTLALGIVGATAIFSVAYGVLFKPLPFHEPDRLVQLWEVNPLFNWTEAEVAPGNVISWRERNSVFTGIAYYLAGAERRGGLADMTLGGHEPSRLRALQVSPDFFDLLGVPPAHGRVFQPGEDVPGRHRVAVLSDRYWRHQLAGRPDVIGTSLPLNGSDWTVIGVMPRDFVFDAAETDLWIPLAIDQAKARSARQPHIFRAIARLKPDVSVERARAELLTIAAELEREYPETNRQMSVGVGPLDDWMVGRTRRALLLFLAGVGLVLLLACANVANLLIVRVTERRPELSVRSALGASRGRVMRQLLIEAAVVAGVATAIAVPIADACVRVFVSQAPIALPRITEIAINPAVLSFSVALAFLTTMMVGWIPAAQATRGDLRPMLADAARGPSAASARAMRAMVAVQIAVAVVLLTAATINARSLRALLGIELGFDPDGLMTAQLSLPAARYPERGRNAAFFEELVARLRADPRVQGAGASSGLPVTGGIWTGDLFIEGQPDVHGRDLKHRSITSGYLETLRLPIVAGRSIRAADTADQPLVVAINETLARRYFAGKDPIGQRIAFDPPAPNVRWRTIVGVVRDEPQQGLGTPIAPQVFDSEGQEEMRGLSIVVRSTAPPVEIARLMRDRVRELDPRLVLTDVRPLNDSLGHVLAPQRLAVALSAAFGAVGLVLSAIGVYGVVIFAVAARTREIGVRMACGATSSDVLRLMIREHMTAIAGGIVGGTALATAVASVIASRLFGVPALDVGSIAIGAAGLLVVGLIACTLPARRVGRIDPVRALKVS